jgi:hypothetical protein
VHFLSAPGDPQGLIEIDAIAAVVCARHIVLARRKASATSRHRCAHVLALACDAEDETYRSLIAVAVGERAMQRAPNRLFAVEV